ncbi:MAG: RagB/SusD family nutrient uptake outer membrane protein [Chitinophagaceae bacterium]
MKSLIKIIIPCFFAMVLITGCSKSFLDRPPLSQISTDNFYKTTADLRLATAALYSGSPWGDWNYNCYLPVGEVLSGNMAVGYWGDAVQLITFSVTGLNGIMISDWKSMYKIIAHCNTVINAINEKAPNSIPEKDKKAAIAEAKFIRGFAYYNLAIHWGAVPITEDNSALIQSPLLNRIKVEDVYKFVSIDLTYAAQNLPVTDQKGRLTMWSAQGMLGKIYLTMAGLNQSGGMRNQALLDSAKKYAGNVCKNSGLALMTNYADLFKTQFNDNPESLFALQWSPGAQWLEGNMLQIYSPGGSEISANGQAGWFGIQPTIDMFNLYTSKDSIRRKATFMLRNDHYPELNAAGGGFTYGGDAGLKKHIVGTNKDNSAPTMDLVSSTEHNSLLRLADVYLIYSEALLGNNVSTSDADALLYFNKVRNRAGIAPVATIAIDSIIRERRIELAGESQYWTDLVRLSYYNPSKAINMLNSEQRVTFSYSNGVATPSTPYGIITPATIGAFSFPIPSTEITANPKLAEPPVAYY